MSLPIRDEGTTAQSFSLTILQGRSPHTLTSRSVPRVTPSTKYQFLQVRARVKEEQDMVKIFVPILQSICFAEKGYLDDRVPPVWELTQDWQEVKFGIDGYIRDLDPASRKPLVSARHWRRACLIAQVLSGQTPWRWHLP